jgi:protein-tyrosine kinase
MTMNEKPPMAPSSSLIERAAEIYGLREAMRGGSPTQVRGGAAEAPALSPVAMPITKPGMDIPIFDRAAEQTQAETPRKRVFEATPTKRSAPRQTGSIDLAALGEAGFIVPGAPPSPLSEEFRLVKRQLLLSAFGGRNTPAVDKGRLILMCSAQPNEGKTFCSVNLALSMAAETEIEVLLVDADVAKPEILSTLGLAGGRGLMDALADPAIDAEDLIIGTNIPGLSVLPAGRQSNTDTELLASDRTPQIIDQLAARHPRRIILFDSAPALAASPASVLALHVGQIMLVVRADQTTESELREALAMLEGNARIQMALNGVTFDGSNRKYGYYYGFGEKS